MVFEDTNLFNKTMSKCKLCNLETTLLKKSHIIPEFFYRECNLFDKKHQITVSEANSQTKEIQHKSKLNTGLYDREILCGGCDNKIIGKLESYLKPLFYGGDIGYADNPVFTNYKDAKGKPFVLVSNMSYSKTKLGMLSILLRSSWSRQQLFKDVNLGSDNEEELRYMIYNSDSGYIEKFPIIFLSVLGQKRSYGEVIAQPKQFRHDKGSGIGFLLGGLFILFYIEHNYTYLELEHSSMTPNGTMVINEIMEDGLGWIKTFLGLQ